MKRVVWFSLGVAVTVVVVVRGRRVMARYLPAALVDQAAGAATGTVDRTARFVRDFRTEFTAAYTDREKYLMDSLLAEGQAPPSTGERSIPGYGSRDPWDEDEEDLGYSF